MVRSDSCMQRSSVKRRSLGVEMIGQEGKALINGGSAVVADVSGKACSMEYSRRRRFS
jgi:hypothetical protein